MGSRWKKYNDLSLMGIGCNILGYAEKNVDRSVNAIKTMEVL